METVRASVHWELWDGKTGNMISACATEAAALALVRRAVEEHGAESIVSWGLLQDPGDEDDDTDQPPALSGRVLVERALRTIPSPQAG